MVLRHEDRTALKAQCHMDQAAQGSDERDESPAVHCGGQPVSRAAGVEVSVSTHYVVPCHGYGVPCPSLMVLCLKAHPNIDPDRQQLLRTQNLAEITCRACLDALRDYAVATLTDMHG